MEQRSSWKNKRFSSSQDIPPFYGKQNFITAFTGASHLSLSWAHNSGSIQFWGTRLYFVTWHVFTVTSFSDPTQPLSWSTTPCQLSATAYSIYSQLPSILEAIPPSANWRHAMLWWQAPTYLAYVAFYDGFIVTNDSEEVLSVWIINTTVFFLLDIFPGSSGKVTYHASKFRWKFCVLKAIQLSVVLKDMCNSCFHVYGIYIYIYIYIYICMLKHQIILNVNTVFYEINCLAFFSTSSLYSSVQC